MSIAHKYIALLVENAVAVNVIKEQNKIVTFRVILKYLFSYNITLFFCLKISHAKENIVIMKIFDCYVYLYFKGT